MYIKNLGPAVVAPSEGLGLMETDAVYEVSEETGARMVALPAFVECDEKGVEIERPPESEAEAQPEGESPKAAAAAEPKISPMQQAAARGDLAGFVNTAPADEPEGEGVQTT
jgi:hypothetical protein